MGRYAPEQQVTNNKDLCTRGFENQKKNPNKMKMQMGW